MSEIKKDSHDHNNLKAGETSSHYCRAEETFLRRSKQISTILHTKDGSKGIDIRHRSSSGNIIKPKMLLKKNPVKEQKKIFLNNKSLELNSCL